jgi:hypothetical protein
MHTERRFLTLLGAVLAVALLPLLGSYLSTGGPPPEFGVFPPHRDGAPSPGYSPLVFYSGVATALLIVAIYLIPRWFGFRAAASVRCRSQGERKLPWWFWAGLLVNLVSWGTMWWGSLPWAAYTFLPLWWGFILAVDGLVYLRAGRSLIACEKDRLLTLALVSVPAWYLFEFLNYYAVEFWVYPQNEIFPPLAHKLWYLVSFTTVLPAIFEWYTLLHTFDGLWNRWSHGPKMKVPRTALGLLLTVGAVAMVLFGAFPFPFFILLWVGPPIVLLGSLSMLKFWTPVRPIADGNWSPVLIAGLASIINGFFWELWNYGSVYFQPTIINPNYWYYDIPYVSVFKPFSEMPFLGYFGYLPFGGLAWACWLVAAHLLRFNPEFDLTPATSMRAVPERDLGEGSAVISR